MITAAVLEQSRLANPNAVVRLPNLPFEIRFGSAARSAKMPMRVAASGKDGAGYRVVLPKDWVKKWGVAVNLSLTVLRVAMQLGAASMGCYHAHVPDMTIDRARLKTADELYEEVNKGLDPATREALEKGAPECKALSEASFQMLKGELTQQDPGLDLTGLVKVVGGSGATLCTEWVHGDVADEFRAKGAAMLRPKPDGSKVEGA